MVIGRASRPLFLRIWILFTIWLWYIKRSVWVHFYPAPCFQHSSENLGHPAKCWLVLPNRWQLQNSHDSSDQSCRHQLWRNHEHSEVRWQEMALQQTHTFHMTILMFQSLVCITTYSLRRTQTIPVFSSDTAQAILHIALVNIANELTFCFVFVFVFCVPDTQTKQNKFFARLLSTKIPMPRWESSVRPFVRSFIDSFI